MHGNAQRRQGAMQCNAMQCKDALNTSPRPRRRLALKRAPFALSTLSLAAHPSHELSTLQSVSMAHNQGSKRAWHEDLDVVPRNPREYHNFTVGDQARVIAGDVHCNTVNHRGM